MRVAYVSVDTVNDVSWRKVWYLRVSLYENVREDFNKVFPFLLG